MTWNGSLIPVWRRKTVRRISYSETNCCNDRCSLATSTLPSIAMTHCAEVRTPASCCNHAHSCCNESLNAAVASVGFDDITLSVSLDLYCCNGLATSAAYFRFTLRQSPCGGFSLVSPDP